MGCTGIKYRLKSEYVTELNSQAGLVILGKEQIAEVHGWIADRNLMYLVVI